MIVPAQGLSKVHGRKAVEETRRNVALPPAPLLFHSHLYIEEEFSTFAYLAQFLISS